MAISAPKLNKLIPKIKNIVAIIKTIYSLEVIENKGVKDRIITINDIGEEIIDINYCKTRIDARNYAVNKQNSGYNVCGNCVRRLYKNEDDN